MSLKGKLFVFTVTFILVVSVSTGKPNATPNKNPSQGQECLERKCQAGLTCIGYYGIAGPQGPEFKSCEIPCKSPQGPCPKDQSCISIPDGPGPVCRPNH